MPFPEANNTNFPQALKTYFKHLKYPQNEFLKYHQFIVNQYLKENPLQRGLLVMHGVGTGKTLIAASICELYRKLDPNRRIIVLLAKSLVNNFKKNVVRYANEQVTKSAIKISKKQEIEQLESAEIVSPPIPEKTLDISDFLEENPNLEAPSLDPQNVLKPYKFVSLNASNMFIQLYKSQKTREELDFEKNLEDFAEIATQSDFLENTLLVVDEAHNLFNSISNGSKNAIALYDRIMSTKNIKLIFLSGTPVVNHPFELVPCFNMLKGPIYLDSTRVKSKERQTTTLFPENRDDFDNFFIDYTYLKIKNASRFQNRIIGLASYFGDKYSTTHKDEFPEQLPTKIEIVHMSPYQFSMYSTARDFEKEESPGFGNRNPIRFSEKSGMSSTYRIKSRQACNFAFPEYALGPQIKKKTREKFIAKMQPDDLKNIKKYSPKMNKILENVKAFPKTSGVIYSEFVSGEGLAIFSRVLEENGYIKWDLIHEMESGLNTYQTNIEILGQTKKKPQKNNMISSKQTSANQKSEANISNEHSESENPSSKGTNQSSFLNLRYAIITGDISIDQRDLIINAFNSPENKHGKIISLLLISRAGAEGLDLKNARHIHIMEPFWNSARIEQVIARVIRFRSHSELPKEERNVQPFIYLSDYPEDVNPKKRDEEPTTDIDIFTKANQAKIIINDALHNVVEASIDCSAHAQNNASNDALRCKLCAPTNVPLYHPVISKDMTLPDPCTYPEEKTIKAHEIQLEETGEKYYFTREESLDGGLPAIILYMYQPSIDAYVQMPKNHPYYADLMRSLLN